MSLIKILFCLSFFFFCGCSKKSKSQSYQIGIDPSWYPLQVASQEKNIYAFSIELLTQIAKQERLELSIQQMSWDNLFWGLKNKQYNAVLTSLRPYIFYEKQFSFSDLYLHTGPVIVTGKHSNIKKNEDLQGKEIAVVRGSSAALLLQAIPGIILQGYDSIPFVLEALENQQVDGAGIEILIAQNYVRDLYSDTMKIVGPPLSKEGLRLVTLFHKAQNLVDHFDKGLLKLKKNGEYEKLLKKWGLSPDGEPIAHLDQKAILKPLQKLDFRHRQSNF